MANQTVGLSYGVLSDPLDKQLDKQGLKYDKKASEYYGKPVQKSVFHISIESQEPNSVIRYVIRSFVTKEEN